MHKIIARRAPTTRIACALGAALLLALCPRAVPAAESSAPTTSFLERMNDSISSAAQSMVDILRKKQPDLLAEPGGIDIGVFKVVFSDGGVLEIGLMAREQMIASLSAMPEVNVLGELAFSNAPYAVKAKLSPPLQGKMNISWTLESREGDIDADYKILASASSPVALPSDPLSLRNLLLYVKRPEGKPELPSVDVPLLGVDFGVFVERRTPKGWQKTYIDSGGWLASGEQFRISLEPNTDCFAYLFIQDSLGDFYSLFPAPGIRGGNRLEGGETRWIPGDDGNGKPLWYYLDDNAGTETLYLVADYEPIENIDEFLTWFSGQPRDKRMEGSVDGWAVQDHARKNIRYQVFDGKTTEAMRQHFPFVKVFEISHR